MALKFVKVTGLSKVFDSISGTGAATLVTSKAGVSGVADENSILFITGITDDATKFGNRYKADTHWIWAKGQLYEADGANNLYLSSIESSTGDITLSDNIEMIIRKLKKQVEDAKISGVTSLTTSGTSPILMTTNTSATGAVTINASHGKQLTSGTKDTSYGVKTSNTSFKTTEIRVDEFGHVTSVKDNVITLGSAALEASTAFATSGHTHNVSIYGDVSASAINIGSSATGFNVAIKDGVVTKAKLSDSIFGSVASGDTSLVTGGDVYTYVNNKVAASVSYLGTVATAAEITAKTTAEYGDFVRSTAAFDFNNSSVHAGDMLILNSSTASAGTDAANWTIVHGENDSWRAVKVNGTLKIASNVATALNIVDSSNIKVSFVNNAVKLDSSFVSMVDGSNGVHGIADVADVAAAIKDNEFVISTALSKIVESTGLTENLEINWENKFPGGTSIVSAIKDLSTNISELPKVSYVQTVTSTSTGAVKLGTIKVGTSNYDVYGKDTVWNGTVKTVTASDGLTYTGTDTVVVKHADGSTNGASKSNIGGVSGTTITIPVISTDKYGHISALSTSTFTHSDSDEKVKTTVTTNKMYVIGQLDASKGTTSAGVYDAAVYTLNGSLYATALYEGTTSIHAASASDWGAIA